jgi:rubrerythrin
MSGFVARWILARVVRSGLAFESEAIEMYRKLTQELGGSKSCSDSLHGSLCHLLAEEELHWRLLEHVAAGTLSVQELERHMAGHPYGEIDSLAPLNGPDLERWGGHLARALEQEEKTWVFYGNLRRMSKIPAVKQAFEVLAGMEKEHLDILRRLLGRS